MSTVSSRVKKKMCAIFCGVIIVNEMLCNCYLWKLPMANNLGLEDLDLDINQQATECSTLIGGAVTKGFGAAAPWRQQQYPPWHRIQARSSTPEWFVEKKSFWIDQYIYTPHTSIFVVMPLPDARVSRNKGALRLHCHLAWTMNLAAHLWMFSSESIFLTRWGGGPYHGAIFKARLLIQ